MKRFRDKYVVDPETGCWNWTGSLDQNGYGTFWYDGGVIRSHILSYRLATGQTSRQLDHLCRNKKCCNPEHLEEVTTKVNTQRGLSAKVTPEEVLTIRRLYATGKYSQKYLAIKFGVGQPHISDIVRGKSWDNVEIMESNFGKGRRHIEIG